MMGRITRVLNERFYVFTIILLEILLLVVALLVGIVRPRELMYILPLYCIGRALEFYYREGR